MIAIDSTVGQHLFSARRHYWSRQIQEFESGLDADSRRPRGHWPTSFYKTPLRVPLVTADLISWLVAVSQASQAATLPCTFIVGQLMFMQLAFLTIATKLDIKIVLASPANVATAINAVAFSAVGNLRPG